MSLLIFSKYQNPDEGGSNACESNSKQARRASFPSLMSFVLAASRGVVQAKGESSYFKRSGLKLCLPTSQIWTKVGLLTSYKLVKKKSLIGVPCCWGLVNSRYSWVDSHHRSVVFVVLHFEW